MCYRSLVSGLETIGVNIGRTTRCEKALNFSNCVGRVPTGFEAGIGGVRSWPCAIEAPDLRGNVWPLLRVLISTDAWNLQSKRSEGLLSCEAFVNQRISGTVRLPENPPPPRNAAGLASLRFCRRRFPHALAGGLVLLLVMAFFGVLPACCGARAVRRGLFFVGGGCFLLPLWRLPSAVRREGSPALGVGGRGQRGQDQRRARGLRRMEQRCDLLGEPRAVTQCSGLNQMVVIVKVARCFGSRPRVAIDVR